MKKTIISTLAVMLAMPAVATGISPNDTGDNMCIYNVLNTYTGPANLQAGWQANTIQLKWYNGDQQLNVQSAANNCTYDSGLTIPSTAPTKTGYTFAGWKIKAASNPCLVGPVCGLTSSLAAIDGEHTWAKGEVEGNPRCQYDGYYTECSDSAFTSLNTHEWKVEFSHGIVRGTASCNNNPGGGLSVYNTQVGQILEQIDAGILTEEEGESQLSALESQWYSSPGTCQPAGTFSSSSAGQYCWCHAESYTPNGGSSCNVSSLAWVSYDSDLESADDCADNCANICAGIVQYGSASRAAVFGVAGN